MFIYTFIRVHISVCVCVCVCVARTYHGAGARDTRLLRGDGPADRQPAIGLHRHGRERAAFQPGQRPGPLPGRAVRRAVLHDEYPSLLGIGTARLFLRRFRDRGSARARPVP